MTTSPSTSGSRLDAAKSHSLWRDRLSVSVILVALVVNALAIIIVVSRLRPLNYAIPVRYTSVAAFDTLGPWYTLYAIPLYGVLVMVANVGLAMKAHSRSRIGSFFLLLAAVVVALVCLVIGNAFTAVL